jgi:hypothetical protein
MNKDGHQPNRHIRHDERGRPYIHYTELPEEDESSPLHREWNTYRREVGRMLAEGHEGKVALIHRDTILGLFDSWVTASLEAERLRPLHPIMGQQIREREPVVPEHRNRPPCPVLYSPLIPTASSSQSVSD